MISNLTKFGIREMKSIKSLALPAVGLAHTQRIRKAHALRPEYVLRKTQSPKKNFCKYFSHTKSEHAWVYPACEQSKTLGESQ